MRSSIMRQNRYQPRQEYKPRRSSSPAMARLITMLGMTTAIGVGTLVIDSGALPLPSGLLGPSCDIKGNVSINTGERIYHVPGQKYYDGTIIRSEYGERWFCSELEARQAGWRKSGV